MPRVTRLPTFILEWRTAPVCGSSCSVCNLIDISTNNEEKENRLDFNESISIIDDFCSMMNNWRFHGVIRISGGNYRAYDDFFPLIKYMTDKNIDVEIMGCPANLRPILPQLKELPIKKISLFLYGIGEKHDAFKRSNDFSDTVDVYNECRKNKLQTGFVFLMNKNFYNHPDDLDDIADFILEEKIDEFEFKRFPYIYNYDHPGLTLKPGEFFTIIFSIFQQYMKSLREYITEESAEEKITDYESLWALLFRTWGMNYYQPGEQGIIHSGCSVGSGKISIRADGVVYPCLLLPLNIGQVPKESLRNIFIHAEDINRMRDTDNFMLCKTCDLAQVCRGCPGIAFQDSGDYLGKDPYCWIEEI
jgi:radical SAM protein with 4Fe4S-binding SPASM domain